METIYEEMGGAFRHRNVSGIYPGCGDLWDEIKDRIAAGDYIPYAAPVPTWDELRAKRNALLSTCDWTQLADAQISDESKTLWLQYRQALRDLPEVYADPSAVIWPTAPEAVAAGQSEISAAVAADLYDYNESTNKYHRPDCRFANELTLRTLAELAELSAIPCGVCCPPAYDGSGLEGA